MHSITLACHATHVRFDRLSRWELVHGLDARVALDHEVRVVASVVREHFDVHDITRVDGELGLEVLAEESPVHGIGRGLERVHVVLRFNTKLLVTEHEHGQHDEHLRHHVSLCLENEERVAEGALRRTLQGSEGVL